MSVSRFRAVLPLFVCCLFLLPQIADAWGGGGSSSSPRLKKKSTPKRTYTPPPVPAQPPEQRHVVSSVSYHVQFKSIDGWYPIEDPREEGREWLCKLSYAPEVKKISDTKYEVFSNFKGKVDESGETVPVVVHFRLEGAEENWKVKSRKLYSVNGTEI